MVPDERRDGGQHVGVRLDELGGVGSLGAGGGAVVCPQRMADVGREEGHCRFGDRLGRLVVATGERQHVVVRHSPLEDRQAGTHRVDVLVGEPVGGTQPPGDQEPLGHQGLEEPERDPGAGRQVGERQSRRGVGPRASPVGRQLGDERLVRGVELPAHHAGDGGQGEAALAQRAHPLQLGHVVVVVPGEATGPARRLEETLALVVPDGVDAHPGPVRQLFDAELHVHTLGVLARTMEAGAPVELGPGCREPGLVVRLGRRAQL